MQILSNLWAKWLPTSDGLLLPNSTQRVGWLATSEFSSLSSLGYFNKLLPIRLITKMPCCCFLTLLWSCLVGNSWSCSFLFGDWLKHKLRFKKNLSSVAAAQWCVLSMPGATSECACVWTCATPWRCPTLEWWNHCSTFPYSLFPVIEELENGCNSPPSVKVLFADSVSSDVGKRWETPCTFLWPE